MALLRWLRAERRLGQGVASSAADVLAVMASYVSSDGLAWPSLATLEADTGLSRSTVQRALASLLEHVRPPLRREFGIRHDVPCYEVTAWAYAAHARRGPYATVEDPPVPKAPSAAAERPADGAVPEDVGVSPMTPLRQETGPVGVSSTTPLNGAVDALGVSPVTRRGVTGDLRIRKNGLLNGTEQHSSGNHLGRLVGRPTDRPGLIRERGDRYAAGIALALGWPRGVVIERASAFRGADGALVSARGLERITGTYLERTVDTLESWWSRLDGLSADELAVVRAGEDGLCPARPAEPLSEAGAQVWGFFCELAGQERAPRADERELLARWERARIPSRWIAAAMQDAWDSAPLGVRSLLYFEAPVKRHAEHVARRLSG